MIPLPPEATDLWLAHHGPGTRDHWERPNLSTQDWIQAEPTPKALNPRPYAPTPTEAPNVGGVNEGDRRGI